MKRQAEQGLDQQQATPADKLVTLAESMGCDESALDDLVHGVASKQASAENNAHDDDLDDERHDLASQQASDINNGGVSAQVAWLLENGVTADAIESELRESVQPQPAMEPRV
ncbi:hypothetical protein [Geopseudomonas aromaticivorans]